MHIFRRVPHNGPSITEPRLMSARVPIFGYKTCTESTQIWYQKSWRVTPCGRRVQRSISTEPEGLLNRGRTLTPSPKEIRKALRSAGKNGTT